MAFSIKDPATDAAVRELAKLEGVSLTATIRAAVEDKLQARRQKLPLEVALDELAAEFAKYPKTGLKADKAWFDKMWGDI